ncbi:hypothetical protein NL676_030012 [Syzygium grande]|nr:hypothetical protein NL676_030012 [Syzygium grande]
MWLGKGWAGGLAHGRAGPGQPSPGRRLGRPSPGSGGDPPAGLGGVASARLGRATLANPRQELPSPAGEGCPKMDLAQGALASTAQFSLGLWRGLLTESGGDCRAGEGRRRRRPGSPRLIRRGRPVEPKGGRPSPYGRGVASTPGEGGRLAGRGSPAIARARVGRLPAAMGGGGIAKDRIFRPFMAYPDANKFENSFGEETCSDVDEYSSVAAQTRRMTTTHC